MDNLERSGTLIADEFVAMLAHDLRNPLGPIRNAMQILRVRAGSDERTVWAIDLVERQVDELVCMIDAACEISRINRGLITAAPMPFAMADALRDAVAASGPMLGRRQQSCRIELLGDAPAAHGDRKRIEQAVRAMVRCVSRALPAGGAIVVDAVPEGEGWKIGARPAQREMHAGGEATATPPPCVSLMLLRALAAVLGATITVTPAGGAGYEYEIALR